jgi:hypothetical protein
VRALIPAIAIALTLAAPSAGGGVPTLPYPSALAAIGDSWTGPDAAADSWATGTNKSIDSQYLRILAHNPAIRGHPYNLAEAHAVTGPEMSDLAFQAGGAIAEHADYIEIALGENDACRGTPVALFTREFKTGLARLTRALPDAHVFVLSIEDVANQWRAIDADPAGRRALKTGSTLDCSLGAGATRSQLAAVAAGIAVYNRALRQVCEPLPRCKYDHDAVFRMQFTASDFDPYELQELSPTGQRALSAVAWHAGYRFGRG